MLLAFKNVFYGIIMVFIVSLRELVTAKLLQSASFYIMSLYIDSQYQQVVMVLAVVFIERFMNYKTKKEQIWLFYKMLNFVWKIK